MCDEIKLMKMMWAYKAYEAYASRPTIVDDCELG